MGATFRSDINAGFALGQAVAQKALARARADGADRKWTGAVPIGPRGFDLVWEPSYALVRRERLSEPREVRLLAPLAAMHHDAYLASHDAKYTYWRLRPNMADPTIAPLIPQPNGTSIMVRRHGCDSPLSKPGSILVRPDARGSNRNTLKLPSQVRLMGGHMRSKATRFVPTMVAPLLLLLVIVPTDAVAQIYHLKELNSGQVRALERDKTVVLLPGGILEQHGPYLPAFSDGYMNERLTQQIAEAIVERPGWKALIFPLIPLGAGGANEIGGKYVFDGTYAVRFSTLRAVFMDLATELGEAGFRWIIVVHLHGAPNHNRALDQASDYFRDTYGGRMAHLFGLLPVIDAGRDVRQALDEKVRQEDGFAPHAGMGETSVLLYLRPDLVSPAHTQAPPHTGRDWNDLVRIAQKQDWPGYFGSPRLASAAHGAKGWRALSSRFVEYALKMLDGVDLKQVPRYADAMTKSPANVAIDNAALARDSEVERKQTEWLRKMGLK